MPSFSTFSIYEKEMRTFINKVAEATSLEHDKLTTWFYSEGVMQFRGGQAADYYPYVNENLKKFGHRPLISKQHSMGQTLTGFMTLKNAFINQFAKDQLELKNQLESLFTHTFYNAIESHLPYIIIQSEISSELSAYQDKNGGSLEPVEALKLSIKMFEEKRANNPQLEEDFKNQLILMNEFLDYLSKQAASSGQQFFKPSDNNTSHITSEQLTLK
ncbi:hypothetical protein LEAN103870_06145 [Legionella anisa]|uniref:Uncharacterized protein n=1 Tax=Legionella anisa TaxID=28082 RepID=A0AAX0WPR2_9GAMM|nr:hypothetical protein [Legionella anisa]AWN75595.1 hypothetical protein DLD14_18100 [Legionella anisa]KTC76387.1 hypothetical protein Lani_0460 [Legionella anisa]MBN5934838.1 hypothetical protein [Legionella anisa]MCW8424211.1 hypothetical protein [Legionella anisa]MCW8446671.1 hypothetical protein [Legionella anisa]